MQNSPPSDPGLDERLRLIVSSYQRLTGKLLLADSPRPQAGEGVRVDARSFDVSTLTLTLPLQGGGDDVSIVELRNALWNAPRAIVAHGTENDPIFFYGNRLALQLFEMDLDEFVRLPSRLSAEPLAQGARAKLLEQVLRQGYVDNYSGMRIARSGKRFMIEDGTVWNLVDETGLRQGQAAVFVV
jgi:MEKHLA domain